MNNFIFGISGYNVRGTEINGVLGLNQLKRLDKNIKYRNQNFNIFFKNINDNKYFVNLSYQVSQIMHL